MLDGKLFDKLVGGILTFRTPSNSPLGIHWPPRS